MLADERANFKTSLRSVTKMIRVVARFAEQNRTEINSAVHQTNDVMRTVLSQRQQVGQLLSVMPLAVQNIMAMLGPGNRLLVRLDITSLLPVLGPLLGTLCKNLPGDLCTAIGTDPNAVLGVLGDLLGGGGKK